MPAGPNLCGKERSYDQCPSALPRNWDANPDIGVLPAVSSFDSTGHFDLLRATQPAAAPGAVPTGKRHRRRGVHPFAAASFQSADSLRAAVFLLSLRAHGENTRDVPAASRLRPGESGGQRSGFGCRSAAAVGSSVSAIIRLNPPPVQHFCFVHKKRLTSLPDSLKSTAYPVYKPIFQSKGRTLA